MGHFEGILEIVRGQNEKRERAKTARSDRARGMVGVRVDRLAAEAEAADKEAMGLTSRLTSLDLKLRHFEDCFQKLTASTGLTNVDDIVNKFFFKGEIKDQLNMEIDEKSKSLEALKKEQAELKLQLQAAKDSFKSQTWRDVDAAAESNREVEARASLVQKDHGRVHANLAFVQEGLVTLVKQIQLTTQQPETDLSDVEGSHLWSSEQANDVFTQLDRSLEQLTGIPISHSLSSISDLIFNIVL
jgi:ribosomal protein L29